MHRDKKLVVATFIVFVFMAFHIPASRAEGEQCREFIRFYRAENLDGIQKLLSDGFSVKIQDCDGKTPLAYAFDDHPSSNDFAVQVMKSLIEHGADVNMRGSGEETILAAMVTYEHPQLWQKVLLLLEKGARVTAGDSVFPHALTQGRSDIAGMCIKNMSDVGMRNDVGATPLMWTVRYGDVELTGMLLAKGADVNVRSKYNKTSLMEASEKGHYELADLLIRKGAQVNVQTLKGWSALMWAAEKGYTNVVMMLVDAGADLFAVNNRNETALMIAKKNNHPETAEVIKKAITKKRWKQAAFLVLFIGVPLIIIAIVVMLHVKSRQARLPKDV